MNTEKKRKIFQRYIPIILLFLVSFILGFFFGKILPQIFDPDWGTGKTILVFLILISAAYVGYILQIVIHEAGHLVFGLLSGYRFSSFRIFSWMWIKGDDGIRCKRFSLAGTGGQCLMIPPDPVNGRFPVALYNLGGSLMNLLFGIIFLILYFLLTPFPVISAISLSFGIFNFITALVNGIPMRLSVNNDGYNALSLSKHPQARHSLWIQLKVNEQLVRGVRLKDMPEEWFTVPTDEAMEDGMTASIGVFACNRLMDAGKFQQANQLITHMQQINSGMSAVYSYLLTCDQIYLELIGENRAEAVERMVTNPQKKFMKTMKSFPSVLRTEFALALLFENNSEKALHMQAQFNKLAQKYPYPQDIQAEQELMDIAHQKHHI